MYEPPALPPFEEALRLQQQVAERLRELSEHSEYSVPLAERDVLRTALLLANERIDDDEKLEVIAYVALGAPLTQGTPHLEFLKFLEQLKRRRLKGAPVMKMVIPAMWSVLQPDREWMRSSVELVMSDPVAARTQLRERIEEATREILVSSPLRWDGHSLVSEPRYFALTPRALTGYAIALLIDERRGFAGKLLRCAFMGCPRIFLSLPSDKGGRPPLYCTREHQAKAAALTGAERMAKWRKAKARKAK
jgi:hypothetical protein